MSQDLLINLDNLLHCRSVERSRLEFKEGWDDMIKDAVVRTVSAFSNDLLNLNGGYIILGIKTDDKGNPVLPPEGLDNYDRDKIQREIVGECKGKISPEYIPLVSPEIYQDKTILVIWAPGGDNRPYEAPKKGGHSGRGYHVRSGSATIEATGDIKRQLIEQTAKIPFDDRRSLTGKVENISPVLVKNFLKDVKSYFSRDVISNIRQIYRDMKIVVPVNSHEVPKNIALLFFSEDPEEFFNGAHIEVVQFGDDAGDLIEEKEFHGPLNQQIKSCLNYLNSLGGSLLQKVPGQAEVEKTVPYPYEAMEEALVNAVYHRSYESTPEPVKVYLYPDRMEIISYPGPVAGIQLKHFEPGQSVPQVPARNRRIGELLKELRLAEGRGTGVPKIRRRMQENGSPAAKFDFDETRTYFRVTLPVHPKYRILHTLRTASHLWAIGDKDQA
jgi:ATP-dependent DNA helicase RecG